MTMPHTMMGNPAHHGSPLVCRSLPGIPGDAPHEGGGSPGFPGQFVLQTGGAGCRGGADHRGVRSYNPSRDPEQTCDVRIMHRHERKAGKEDVRTYKIHFVSVLSVAVGASSVVAIGEGGAHAASPARSAICAAARGVITEPWA